MSRDLVSIADILEACKYIQRYTEGMDRSSFYGDSKTQHAVLYLFAVIGEAVIRLSEEYKLAHPHIPWRQIRGMRNVLVHDYEGVMIDKVWVAIEDDVPLLIRLLNDDSSGDV